jgi:hypothetical protein
MMIQVKLQTNSDFIKVYFSKTRSSGVSLSSNWIEARPEQGEFPAAVNVPATGDLQVQDIPEFLEALKLAKMIASGEITFAVELLTGRDNE